MPMLLLVAFFVVNGWTAFRFWQDKQAARDRGWRVPEAVLLTLASIGGSPAALIARRAFRHKTRKEPFSTYLLVIATLQVGAIIGFFVI